MKHREDIDLNAMADEILSSAKAQTKPKPRANKKSDDQQRRLSLRDLQPAVPDREYHAAFTRADRVALVKLLEWCAARATATDDRQLDVNISWCPGSGTWLVWTQRVDSENTTLSEAVTHVLREIRK
jgi:hypothetical protein